MLKTVMTLRDDPGPSKDLKATTTGDEPNVRIQTLPWYSMVGIRGLRVYLQSFIGFLLVASTGLGEAVGIPLDQFGGMFFVAAKLAVAPATLSLLQNLLEIMTKLDVTNPQLRA